MKEKRTAACTCGKVEVVATGAPIVAAICYCDDCQAGGRQIAALPGARAVVDADGGTDYLVYRKDRVRCVRGETLLKAYRLSESSPSQRFVASCCNSALFMSFTNGRHWTDIYRARVRGESPPVQMRLCTRFRTGTSPLPKDVPAYRGFPPAFIARLIFAKFAMVLRIGSAD